MTINYRVRKQIVDCFAQRESSQEIASMLNVELGRGRGISNLDKKARITRPAPLI